MQVSLNIKMADHVKKHTNVKGNNVPKSIKHQNYNLYFATMAMKNMEQATVKK